MAVKISSHANRVFTSVFPIQSHTTPTPLVSPAIGAPRSPGDHSTPTDAGRSDDIARQASAWSTVTRFLSLSPPPKTRTLPKGINSALRIVLETGRSGTSALHSWFLEEVRRLYAGSALPELTTVWANDITIERAEDVLAQTAKLLLLDQSLALRNVDLLLASDAASAGADVADIRDHILSLKEAALHKMQMLVLAAIPKDRLLATLAFLLHNVLANLSDCVTSGSPRISDMNAAYNLLLDLRTVGLLGDMGQKSLAIAVKALIDTYVESYAMRVDWITRQSRVEELQSWVSGRLEPAVRRCLAIITNDETIGVSQVDRDQWQKMATNSLGLNRGKYLLSYVQMWDQSMGAVLDLKEYIKTPEAKQSLAAMFIATLEKDLLHAGAKTSELLTVYVNMIKVFKTLDNRGVLLEKVAQPLRQFLREREDTVKVIAASFLSDLNERGEIVDTAGQEDVCAAIAREVVASEEEALHHVERALDYDDMEWQPDPIDAGPDYKRTKSTDIISYMLTLFEQENFIKEMQNILGERLLRTEDSDLEKETRLVELFKSRLGNDKLQHCEVMLRDMQDSSRIMSQVRSTLDLPTVAEVYAAVPQEGITFSELARKFSSRVASTSTAQSAFIEVLKQAAIYDSSSNGQRLLRNPNLDIDASTDDTHPRFYAQVLSGYFWPELRDDDFAIPSPIAALQSQYEAHFTRVKNLRKLKWLSALGRATVSLSLTDRQLVFEGVTTWQASVIYAFQDPTSSESRPEDDIEIETEAENHTPASRTVSELEEQLNIDTDLLRAALGFWVSKRVLVEDGREKERFTVLESLPMTCSSSDETQAEIDDLPIEREEIGAVKSLDAVLRANKDMYQMFMIGMLTNGGAMDVSRVAMMMKMVVPGFAFGEEEVRWLLGDLVQQGRVVDSDGVFGMKK